MQVGVPPDSPDGGPASRRTAPSPRARRGHIAYPVPDARPWIGLSALASAGLSTRPSAPSRVDVVGAPIVPLEPPAVLAPPRPAHEVALERLEALLASGLLARNETGVFVERLMDEVLRDYLTARFALSAGTRTTRELVKDLLGVSLPGLDVALVESLLADTDLVKFAKATNRARSRACDGDARARAHRGHARRRHGREHEGRAR